LISSNAVPRANLEGKEPNLSWGMAQVVEHLPASVRPQVQSPILSEKKMGSTWAHHWIKAETIFRKMIKVNLIFLLVHLLHRK
jgi:hypothetical protein